MLLNVLHSPSRSQKARARLLNSAIRIFGEKGPEGATVREIARAAGQNVAAIAYYYGSKKQLYHEVIESLVRELKSRLSDVTQQIEQLARQQNASPAEAMRLLKLFLGAVYLRLLSQKEAVHIARLIVREQLGPTPAFAILYDKGFRQLHEALCFLVGVILGQDPRGRETILRTHMLMGQVYFFAMSREAILRRMGWTTLEGKNAELVVRILEENLETILSGLLSDRPTNPERLSKLPKQRAAQIRATITGKGR
jgi:AcrR family transcriptional regulator